MSDDRLKQMYDDQRKELEFRRNREQQIFTWSVAVLLAVIGASLVSYPRENLLASLGPWGALLTSSGILAFTIFSVLWQAFQRRKMQAHQRALVQINEKRGWFDERPLDGEGTIFPSDWKNWGKRNQEKSFFADGKGMRRITGILGAAAFLVAWLLYLVSTPPSPTESKKSASSSRPNESSNQWLNTEREKRPPG